MLTQLLISVNNGLIYLQLGSRKFTFPIDCINFSSTAKNLQDHLMQTVLLYFLVVNNYFIAILLDFF